MTVSANATWELRRDQLIARSLNLAGVLNAGHNPTRDQIAVGVDFLQMLLASLQSDGIILQAIERYSQPLTDGVASYQAPDDTLDVENGAVVRSAQGNDIPLSMISSMRDYNSRSIKTLSGQPTEYYVERNPTGTTTVYLFPVPTADWTAIIYPRVRRLRDNDRGDVSIDVPVKFMEPVALKLAARYARHYNRDSKAKALLDEYSEAHQRAMNDETGRGPMRFTVESLFGGR